MTRLLCFALVILCVANRAFAALVIPDPLGQVVVNGIDGTMINPIGTPPLTAPFFRTYFINFVPVPLTGSASIKLDPFKGAIVTASASGAASYAQLVYYFAVVGPETVTVPIRITAAVKPDCLHCSLADSGFGWGSISFNNFSSGGDIVGGTACVGPECGSNPPDLILFHAPMNVTANTIVAVDMEAEAVAEKYYDTLSGPEFPDASATVDPFIEIDSAFLAVHPDYTLVFSAGIINSPNAVGVPEPSTLRLLGLAVMFLLLCGWGQLSTRLYKSAHFGYEKRPT